MRGVGDPRVRTHPGERMGQGKGRREPGRDKWEGQGTPIPLDFPPVPPLSGADTPLPPALKSERGERGR